MSASPSLTDPCGTLGEPCRHCAQAEAAARKLSPSIGVRKNRVGGGNLGVNILV